MNGKMIVYEKIKTITSNVGLGRYMDDLSSEPAGEIPRIKDIPSPYASGPTHMVYRHHNGTKVFIVETKHKHYEVFKIIKW